ncbi:hypothetical protein [Methylobacterium haplocladii]|uniref:Uncharacterized protein n=1 Tax=Methylobacterium haplocladii TaxID=1176176 RepID=A0A512IL61_9HYPH|nr:hypothetical protein [Methylobacterium haplocladii]GEO98439.1 hypothetical protein MHA02_08270 [Methylobacterium haplocladii]GJD83067.1 hypothetical protein HPGCJGGD_0929 [Methylobacterium haplocladii]
MRASTSFGLVHHGFRAAVIGALALAAAGHADARDGRNGALIGGAAAGVLGGVALGAMLNGGAAPPPGPRPVYVEEEPVPVYVRPRRGPVCHYERRKVWLDEAEFTYKRVEVCE